MQIKFSDLDIPRDQTRERLPKRKMNRTRCLTESSDEDERDSSVDLGSNCSSEDI